jgi:aryl-alcohol dehydrogenase-like predicted oxidoreductase
MAASRRWLHSPPVTAIESDEVLRFLEDSVREGKVRYCGASVGTVTEARRCLKYPVFATLQITFNLVEQAAVETLFPYAESERLGLIGRTPLARGVLTNKYRVTVGPAPETLDPEVQTRRRLALDFLLSEQHPTVEIAALRFILDHPEIATVLTGTSDPKNLRINMTAVSACPLSVDVMAKARRLRDIDGCSDNG